MVRKDRDAQRGEDGRPLCHADQGQGRRPGVEGEGGLSGRSTCWCARGPTFWMRRSRSARRTAARPTLRSLHGVPGRDAGAQRGRRIAGPWRAHRGEVMVCSLPEVKAGSGSSGSSSSTGRGRPGRGSRGRATTSSKAPLTRRHSTTGRGTSNVAKPPGRRGRRLPLLERVPVRVSDLDEAARVVKFLDRDARHPIGWKGGGGPNRYYIENVFEAIQRPGDWYRSTGTPASSTTGPSATSKTWRSSPPR